MINAFINLEQWFRHEMNRYCNDPFDISTRWQQKTAAFEIPCRTSCLVEVRVMLLNHFEIRVD